MDLKSELEKLRESYITSSPDSRLKLIKDRLDDPAALPNKMVTRIAAMEGFVRSLLMFSQASSKAELKKIYHKFRYRKVQTMIEDYFSLKGRKPPEEEFGQEVWNTFKVAVEYRNLLVHECTFLGKRKYIPLETACETVYEKLVHISKFKN